MEIWKDFYKTTDLFSAEHKELIEVVNIIRRLWKAVTNADLFMLNISTTLPKQLVNLFELPKISQRKCFDNTVKTICKRVCIAEGSGGDYSEQQFFSRSE